MRRILLIVALYFIFTISLHSQALFGTTFYGGADSVGTINTFNCQTKELTVLKSLGVSGSAPASGLLQANDGKLYGMTTSGGVNNFGSIYSYDPTSATYTNLKSLSEINGRYPTGTLVQAGDGKLYGMTTGANSDNNGILFSFDPVTSICSKLFDFSDGSDGADPYGSLIVGLDGKLYGMTSNGGVDHGGVIFSFDIVTSTYAKLGDIAISLGMPKGDLAQTADGKLYAWTSGGIYNQAIIFSFDPVTYESELLYNFHTENNSYGGLVVGVDGNLYGLAIDGGSKKSGFLFSLNPSLSTYNKLMDFDSSTGQFPVGTLIKGSDGKLYGMTKRGGNYGYGTIFSFDPSSSNFTKLTDFNSSLESFPVGKLMQAVDGKFYGVTSGEGGTNKGSIFSFDPLTLNFSSLKTFPSNQSANNISGKLMRAGDGKIYGMSAYGGTSRGGVIFSYDPISKAYTELSNLDYVNGNYPFGSLVQGSDKKLYGTTPYGGIYDEYSGDNQGVLFSFDPGSGIYSKLVTLNFYGPLRGSNPFGSLLQCNDGKLYGMTSFGGALSHGVGGGVIFSYEPISATYTRVFDFADDFSDESNGSTPYGSLMQAKDGKLYGMTSTGGANGTGVIFSYDPSSGIYNKLLEFDGTNGSNPYGSLIQARDGKLYAMTYGGGTSDAGVVFSYDLNSAAFTKLKDFDFTNGSHPYGDLMQASDGKLYGMTSSGGSNDDGVIFSYDPVSSTFEKLSDYDGTNGANPYFGSAFIELPELAPLPVTLLNFTGKNNGNINELSWNVANDHGLGAYELQRAGDGQKFIHITAIKASGNGAYNYNDNISRDAGSVFFYRLKIGDINGNFKYSNVVKLSLIQTDLITINPNPFKDVLIATVQSRIQDHAIFVLSDLSGKELSRQSEQLTSGANVVQINGNRKLSNGTYLLSIITSQWRKTVKVIKSN